ncbi:hypothetical protein [Marispirochaeta aestuarii]|uniref:tetratricopeptide repeat protein n=1 Tax=Marispirochaeta aestuarii TaxID=1963862 RepID=UPI0029C93BD4|nr:hypothetical protein [Marispirochaeta aestuarii]
MTIAYETWLKVKFLISRKLTFITLQIVILLSFLMRIGFLVTNSNTPIIKLLENSKDLIVNNFIITLLIDLSLTFLWLFYRRLPRVKGKEIGIIFAIANDTEYIKDKIKKDFIEQVLEQIRKIGLDIKIHVLSEYHTEKLLRNHSLLLRYHRKTNARFILVGKARVRVHKKKDAYAIELNESVMHGNINNELRRELIEDMLSIFPRISMINLEEEFTGFQLTSNIFSFGSLYIIGLSLLYSNRIKEAYEIHRRVLFYPITVAQKFLSARIDKIKNSTKQIIIEEIRLQVYEEYNKDDRIDFKKIGSLISEAECLNHENYNLFTLQAIYYFKVKDLEKSFAALHKASRVSDGDYTWIYSEAFLYGYVGELDKAYTCYKKGFRHNAVKNVHIQCEDFILDVLEEEPEKYQLNYCLGLLYYFHHNDFVLAKERFEKFIEQGMKSGEYDRYIEFARNYIEEIESSE